MARLAKLRVAYGDPIPVDDLVATPGAQAYQEATVRLMESINELYEGL